MDENARALTAAIKRLGLNEVSQRYFKNAGVTEAMEAGGLNATPWSFRQVAGAIYFVQVDHPGAIVNTRPRVLVLHIGAAEVDNWRSTFNQFEPGVHHTVITPAGEILWQSPTN